jgi:predicted methyltransferase
MRYAVCAGAALALCLSAASSFAAESHRGRAVHIPAYITAAVNDSTRPDADRMRDVNRKPAEVLAFAGIKPGMQVAELIPGTGYYTRLLCRIVGDSGHVTQVNFSVHMPPRPAGAGPRRGGGGARPAPAPLGCDNVSKADMTAASDIALPSGLDVVWTTENYHDLHNGMFGVQDFKAFDTVIFNALKPGGEFIVEDHVAPAGSGASDTNKLHRIDPELVKQEVESAGFKLVGESRVLHNPADDHTQIVFKMVDKTDRFLFKFQKPAT